MSQQLDVIKKLLEIKSYIANNLEKEGLMLLKELKDKGVLNKDFARENNWYVCNIIEIISCNNIFEFLNEYAELFDITRCKNIKRVLECSISRNIDNTYVDIVLEEYKKRHDINAVNEILQLNKENLTNASIMLKLLRFYEDLNDIRDIENLVTIVISNINRIQDGKMLYVMSQEFKKYLNKESYEYILKRACELGYKDACIS